MEEVEVEERGGSRGRVERRRWRRRREVEVEQRRGAIACLGRQKETHQKKRETWCVGLKWPPFSGNTQQPTNSWRKR